MTFAPLHFRLKLPNRDERKRESLGGESVGGVGGQNHVVNPKLDAKWAFFREALAVHHLVEF